MSKSKKNKASYVVIVFLSVFSLCTNVNATSFELGVKENDEWEMEITLCDKNSLNQIFGLTTSVNVIKSRIFSFGDNSKDLLTVGNKAKFRIVKIKEQSSGWSVNFKYWDWTTKNFTGSGLSFDDYEIAKNPIGLIWRWRYRYDYFLILPVPAMSYLQDLSYEYGVSTEENKVIHKSEYIHYNIIYQWTYNSSHGYWMRFSISANGIVVYEINGINNKIISGYDFSSFVLITSISIISLIYVFSKKGYIFSE